jgi:hypothetical protein
MKYSHLNYTSIVSVYVCVSVYVGGGGGGCAEVRRHLGCSCVIGSHLKIHNLTRNVIHLSSNHQLINKSSIFLEIMQCIPLKVNRRFGGTCGLHLKHETGSREIFTLVSCLAYYSNLKIEGTCSSETSVDFQRTTRR